MSALEPATHDRAKSLAEKIDAICKDLACLDPGPLAELRRMDTSADAYGAPYFWRLLARYGLAPSKADEPKWAEVVQALAILTPKGRDDAKVSRHCTRERKARQTETDGAASTRSPCRGFGQVLCDGADNAWPDDGSNLRPVFSENRLAQLLGSGDTRADLVRRAARLLAARLPAQAQFDCTDLARLLLYPDDPDVGRSIARDYYARFDRASRSEAGTGDNDPTGAEA